MREIRDYENPHAHNLVLIMARHNSVRRPGKNIADVCGRPMLHWTIDRARASGVASDVVVSTGGEDVAECARDAGANVVMRGGWGDRVWDEVVGRSIDKYMEESGKRFKHCTVMFGTAIFWRASWIREAHEILTKRVWRGLPITHVRPDIHAAQFCFMFRMPKYCMSDNNTYILGHHGIHVDIETPEDMEIARGIMGLIQRGEINYPMEEMVHQEEAIRKYERHRNNLPLYWS